MQGVTVGKTLKSINRASTLLGKKEKKKDCAGGWFSWLWLVLLDIFLFYQFMLFFSSGTWTCLGDHQGGHVGRPTCAGLYWQVTYQSCLH